MTYKRCYKISSRGLEKKEREIIRENPTGRAECIP